MKANLKVEIENLFYLDTDYTNINKWLLDNDNIYNSVKVDEIRHLIGDNERKFYNIIVFSLPTQEYCVLKVYGPLTGKSNDWIKYSIEKFPDKTEALLCRNECLNKRTKGRVDPYREGYIENLEWVKSVFNRLVKLCCAANSLCDKIEIDVTYSILKNFLKELTLKKSDIPILNSIQIGIRDKSL